MLSIVFYRFNINFCGFFFKVSCMYTMYFDLFHPDISFYLPTGTPKLVSLSTSCSPRKLLFLITPWVQLVLILCTCGCGHAPPWVGGQPTSERGFPREEGKRWSLFQQPSTLQLMVGPRELLPHPFWNFEWLGNELASPAELSPCVQQLCPAWSLAFHGFPPHPQLFHSAHSSSIVPKPWMRDMEAAGPSITAQSLVISNLSFTS